MSGRPAGDPTLRWNERAFGSWDEMPMGDGRHRRLAIVYLAATVVGMVAGVVFHSFFFALALLFGALGAVEYAMWRRSRPTSRIPDYRQPEPAEIELEQQ